MYGVPSTTASIRAERGFMLLPVVLLITLLAVVGIMVNREGALGTQRVASSLEAQRVDYVARGGLANAEWRMQQSACGGDITVPTTALGKGTYSATVTAGGATTAYTLSVDQDAWIRSDNPDTNNESDAHIRFESGIVEQALYRFDLSSLPGGAQINSAVAYFFIKSGSPSGGEHPEGSITVHNVTSDWVENVVTWNTFNGSYDPTFLDAIPAQAQHSVWVRINLTAQVQAWVNGAPNYGVLLNSTAEDVHAKYISREGAVGEQPRLEVVVGTAPASPAAIQATGTLANGVSRTLNRTSQAALQPPATSIMGSDPARVDDGWITSGKPAWNYGAHDSLKAADLAGQRSLLRFDLAALPPGAKVKSAVIDLTTTSVNTAGDISVHAITQSWVEGTCQGASCTADGATWDWTDGSTPWATAGVDHDPTAAATVSVPGTVGVNSFDITALADSWFSGAQPNYGVLIKASGANVTFASSDHSDTASRPRLTVGYTCECGVACLVPQGSGNLLLIVRNSASPNAGDTYKKTLFESWGYTVTLIDDEALPGAFDAAFAANDVVYVSSTVVPEDIGNKLNNVTIGVVNEEGRLNDELGISSTIAWPVGDSIDIVDTGHYITQYFPSGALPIYAGDMEGLTVAGTLAPGLQTLANWGGAGSLVLLDQGAVTHSGGAAASRRAMLPLGRNQQFNWDYLNNNGRLIVQRAIAWAAGGDGAPPPVCEADYTATAETGQYSTAAFGSTDAKGITYLPEGMVFNGTTSPAGGAWIIADTVGTLFMTDMDGALLTSAAVPVTPSGVTLVTFGTYANHLAVSDTVAATITYVPLDGGPSVTLSTTGFGVTEPYGVSFIGNSATGTYDGRLLVVDNGSDSVYIVTQLGTLEASFAVTLPSTERLTDIAHLPGADKALIPSDEGNVRIVAFDGSLLREYSTAAFGVDELQGAAIQPLTCEHVIVDRFVDVVKYLDDGVFGLNAHWKLDETSGPTAVDSAGGHDGTWIGTPAWATGVIDGALDFDGVGDYVDAGTFDVAGSGLTLMGWFNAETIPTSDGRIVSKASGPNASDAWWQLSTTDSGSNRYIRMRIKAGGTTTTLADSSVNLTTGRWYFAVATYDNASAEMKLYLDGTEVASGPHAVGGPVDTGPTVPVAIGANGTAERFFDGVLDDVRVYNRALSAAEIADLHAAGLSGPIAHWKLDETIGTTAVDSVGGHDGTFVSIPAWVPGTIDGGLDFDGVDDYLDVGTFDVTGSGLTMMGWFNAETIPDGDPRIISKASGTDPSVPHWQLSTRSPGTDRHLRMRIKAGGTTSELGDSSVFLSPGQWYFAVGTYDNAGAMKLYLDGVEIASGTHAVGGPVDTDPAVPVAIGANGTAERFFDGVLDDVRVYDRALSATEIADLYAAGSGGGGGGPPGYTELHQPWAASTPDNWETVNLGTFGVPANAVAEVAVINSASSAQRWGGVRAVGSSLERRFLLHEAEAGGVDAVTMHVQVDGSSQIEHWSDNTGQISFVLLGYWTGATYVEAFDTFKAGGSNSWLEHNLGAYGVGPNQVAEIVMVNTSTSNERLAGVRPSGAGYQRRFNLHEAEGGGIDAVSMMVETDASSIAEVFAQSDSNIDFYVVGYWSMPPGTYTEAVNDHGQVSAAATWEPADLTTFGVPADAVAQFVITNDGDTAEQNMGVREMGSSLGRLLDLQEAEAGGSNAGTLHVNVDGSSQVQWYAESGTSDRYFYPIGWWVIP